MGLTGRQLSADEVLTRLKQHGLQGKDLKDAELVLAQRLPNDWIPTADTYHALLHAAFAVHCKRLNVVWPIPSQGEDPSPGLIQEGKRLSYANTVAGGLLAVISLQFMFLAVIPFFDTSLPLRLLLWLICVVTDLAIVGAGVAYAQRVYQWAEQLLRRSDLAQQLMDAKPVAEEFYLEQPAPWRRLYLGRFPATTYQQVGLIIANLDWLLAPPILRWRVSWVMHLLISMGWVGLYGGSMLAMFTRIEYPEALIYMLVRCIVLLFLFHGLSSTVAALRERALMKAAVPYFSSALLERLKRQA